MILKKIYCFKIFVPPQWEPLVLNFEFIPTHEEFVLAVRNLLTEENVFNTKREKLLCVEAAKELELPKKGCVEFYPKENDLFQDAGEVEIHHTVSFLFKRNI